MSATAPAAPTRRRPSLGSDRLVELALWAVAGSAAVAILLVPAHLVARVAAAPDAWALVLRPETLRTLIISVALAAVTTVLAVLIAVPIAWLTSRTDMPHRRVWAVLAALPLVIPSYIGAYLFVATFGPRGLVQQAIEGPLGIERLPDVRGFAGAAFVIALYTYPYVLLITQAALARGDAAMEEVSRTLGAGRWATFRRVTLPLIRGPVAASALLVALYTLRDFGAVSIMRVDTFTRVIYIQYTAAFDRVSAAALSLLLVGVAVVVLALEHRLVGRAPSTRTGPGSPGGPRVVPLGQWRWPAWLFCAAIVSLALVVPGVVLASWLASESFTAAGSAKLAGAVADSFAASALGAALTLFLAVSVAWLAVRRRGRLAVAIERVSYVGFALPGVVVALALVFAGRHVGGILYRTLPWLVLGYAILFLPQAVGAVRSTLSQVRPSLEEAGRVLGRSHHDVLATVTLPLAYPGALAALALVFLTAMKELPATLMLSPLDFQTLAMLTWGAVIEAYFAQAATPALVLILLSSLPLALLVRRLPQEAM